MGFIIEAVSWNQLDGEDRKPGGTAQIGEFSFHNRLWLDYNSKRKSTGSN